MTNQHFQCRFHFNPPWEQPGSSRRGGTQDPMVKDYKERTVERPIDSRASQTGKRSSEIQKPFAQCLSLIAEMRSLNVMLLDELRSFSLSVEEFELLAYVANGPLSQSDLRRLTGQTGPSVSRRLCRLESSGWVHREQARGDRRRSLVSLTPEGTDKCQEVDRDLTRATVLFVGRN